MDPQKKKVTPQTVFDELRPILGKFVKYQQPSLTHDKYTPPNWKKCKNALDELITELSFYPSIFKIINPMPYFSDEKCQELDIPQLSASTFIENFNCVPYFIYTNHRANVKTFVLSLFCKLRISLFYFAYQIQISLHCSMCLIFQ